VVLGAACAVERPDSAPEQRASPQGRKLAAAPNERKADGQDGRQLADVSRRELPEGGETGAISGHTPLRDVRPERDWQRPAFRTAGESAGRLRPLSSLTSWQ